MEGLYVLLVPIHVVLAAQTSGQVFLVLFDIFIKRSKIGENLFNYSSPAFF